MPGFYVHLDVARSVMQSLSSKTDLDWEGGPDPQQLIAIATAHPSYFALGAIGPDMFFMLPDFTPPLGSNIKHLLDAAQKIYTALDDNFFEPMEELMSHLGPIPSNWDAILNGLTGNTLALLTDSLTVGMNCLIDTAIVAASTQYDLFSLLGSGVQRAYDEQMFYWSDMLHYRKTLKFPALMWKHAQDDRFKAYALGWMTHVATDIPGHGFVNEKTGGPYRLHWQRHHLIENHMDAALFDSERGNEACYNRITCSGLHRWITLEQPPVDMFGASPFGADYDLQALDYEPNSIHAMFDGDAEMPHEFGTFIATCLQQTYGPDTSENGQCAASPRIMSKFYDCQTQEHGEPLIDTLAHFYHMYVSPDGDSQTFPEPQNPCMTADDLVHGGFPTATDIVNTYWWFYKYLKMATSEYFKFAQPPEEPSLLVIPEFPTMPPFPGSSSGGGSGGAGPTPNDDSTFKDIVHFLIEIVAWIEWIMQVVVWALALLPSLIAGVITYPVREFFYLFVLMPVYNAWLALHWYMSFIGLTYPNGGTVGEISEINEGLYVLGHGVEWNWQDVQVALQDPFGGLGPVSINPNPTPCNEPSGANVNERYPLGAILDPPSEINSLVDPLLNGDDTDAEPAIDVPPGMVPSEYLRPWRWPSQDQEQHLVRHELPMTHASPYVSGDSVTSLVRDDLVDKGSSQRRAAYESCENEEETIHLNNQLPGEHMGGPIDYSSYLLARLTRDDLDIETLPGFNLDADRGYGYKCWDYRRHADGHGVPHCFKDETIPGTTQTSPDFLREYNAPIQPGYGWNHHDQENCMNSGTAGTSFNTEVNGSSVLIRYIDTEAKVQ